jgi:flagellar biosynthesis protein FlhB
VCVCVCVCVFVCVCVRVCCVVYLGLVVWATHISAVLSYLAPTYETATMMVMSVINLAIIMLMLMVFHLLFLDMCMIEVKSISRVGRKRSRLQKETMHR